MIVVERSALPGWRQFKVCWKNCVKVVVRVVCLFQVYFWMFQEDHSMSSHFQFDRETHIMYV